MIEIPTLVDMDMTRQFLLSGCNGSLKTLSSSAISTSHSPARKDSRTTVELLSSTEDAFSSTERPEGQQQGTLSSPSQEEATEAFRTLPTLAEGENVTCTYTLPMYLPRVNDSSTGSKPATSLFHADGANHSPCVFGWSTSSTPFFQIPMHGRQAVYPPGNEYSNEEPGHLLKSPTSLRPLYNTSAIGGGELCGTSQPDPVADVLQDIMVTPQLPQILTSPQTPASVDSGTSTGPLSEYEDYCFVDPIPEISADEEATELVAGLSFTPCTTDGNQLQPCGTFPTATPHYTNRRPDFHSFGMPRPNDVMQNHGACADVSQFFADRTHDIVPISCATPLSTDGLTAVSPTTSVSSSNRELHVHAADIPGQSNRPPLASNKTASELRRCSENSVNLHDQVSSFNLANYADLEDDGLYFTEDGIKYVEKSRSHQRGKRQRQPVKVRMNRIMATRGLADLDAAVGVPPGLQLWEFLLNHLELAKHRDSLCWTNRQRGVFRFNEPSTFAKLWGTYRGSETMTYEKMSRTMRYYYGRDILEPSNDKLAYKFTAHVNQQVLAFQPQPSRASSGSAERTSGSEEDTDSSVSLSSDEDA